MSASEITPAAVIFGCAGLELSDAEKRFFAAVDPLGFILFARNVATPDQVRRLVAALRDCVGRADAPVLIDQEGGRVQRLKPPHWRDAPPASVFARLATQDHTVAVEAARLNARVIAEDLFDLGIDVDCTPVLDVPVPGAHDVIGDRAYGAEPGLIAALGRAVCEGMLEGGVLPVIKQVPGHGRATVDSHLALPTVTASLNELRASDFQPFAALKDAPWAMTAHVVYEALDPAVPATCSRRVIADVVRGEIGFDGVLISDDLSMKALKGDFGERTRLSLAAGCDLVLHCNGDMAEMRAVADAIAPLSDEAARRVAAAAARKCRQPGFDRVSALAHLDGWLSLS